MLQARGYERVWDMSACEQDGQYFEGTGVLVLDRVNGVAYVNISERAHPDLAQRWADELGYKVNCSDIIRSLSDTHSSAGSCLAAVEAGYSGFRGRNRRSEHAAKLVIRRMRHAAHDDGCTLGKPQGR